MSHALVHPVLVDYIAETATIVVDPDPIHIPQGDQVVWVAAPSVEFVVHFKEESPFKRGQFHKGIVTGPTVKQSRAQGFKYYVQVGTEILDPEVVIDPPPGPGPKLSAPKSGQMSGA